jgi:hypothetical protein
MMQLPSPRVSAPVCSTAGTRSAAACAMARKPAASPANMSAPRALVFAKKERPLSVS